MDNENPEKKIILPVEVQKKILKFFLKTSMPRLAQQEKKNEPLSEKRGQEEK